MFSRARWRLTLWFTGVFAFILLVLCAGVYFSARTSTLGQVNDDLNARSDRIVGAARGPGGVIGNLSRAGLLDFATDGGYFYRVISPELTLTAPRSADSYEWPDTTQIASHTANGSEIIQERTPDDERVRIHLRTEYDRLGQPYYFMVGRTIEPELTTLRRLAIILIGSAAGGLVLAGYGGFWLAGRALKPIQETMDAQRQFVADASHELRTPLSLIRANAEIIKRGEGRPVEAESVDDIISETDRLSYLVSQMLTLARTDSSAETFERVSVDMNNVAEDVTRQMRLLAAPKQIEVSLSTNGAATVDGDEQRLGELLLILLDNSIKYTDSGGKVEVDIARLDGQVRIAVSDTGRGIPANALPHVFDRFYRADKARSREMGGTGLGLAIARWITEKHGGSIDVQSEAGQGTRVTVELPASG